MHACGHDLHVAGLVGAARPARAARRARRRRGVHVPAGRGGPRRRGADDRRGPARRGRAAASTRHTPCTSTPPSHPLGMWFGRPGPADGGRRRGAGSASSARAATARSRSAPRTRSRLACEIVVALQTMVTRQFDVFDPVVVTVGQVRRRHQGQHHPRRRRLRGDRAQPVGGGAGRGAAREIERLVTGIAAAHGLTAEVEHLPRLPGHGQRRRRVRLRPGRRSSTCSAPTATPTMPTPRWARRTSRSWASWCPSAYVNLSACPVRRLRPRPDNHSPRADFDDSVLPDAAALLAELALRRLSR